MTAPFNDRIDQYTAAGGETLFTYTFPITAVIAPALHGLTVETLTGTVIETLTEGVDYTITGAGNPGGGTIVLDIGVFPAGAIAGVGWTIYSSTPVSRVTDFKVAGDFFAEEVNDQLDDQIHILQDQERDIGLALKLQLTGALTNITFPPPGANEFIRWNSLGTELQTSPFVTVGGAIGVDETNSDPTKDKLTSDLLAKRAEDAALFLGLDAASDQADLTDAINELKGANIASAATTDIWAATGNLIHITGVADITSFGTARQAGVERTLIFDGILRLVNSANLDCPGSEDIITKVGTRIVVRADTTTAAVITLVQDDVVLNLYPPKFIEGLQLANNGADAVEDIDVAVGFCRAENIDTNMDLAALLTKRIDANWAVGTGNGGFPSGLTLTNDTWYHFFLIKRTDTGVVDAGFDTSLTATNLLADATDYDAYRRIGSIFRATATNLAFFQNEEHFMIDVPINDVPNEASSATAQLKTLTTPLGLKTLALIKSSVDASGQVSILITDPQQTDSAPVLDVLFSINHSSATANDTSSSHSIRTNVSSQIRLRASGTAGIISIVTHGWVDRRGKDS